MMNHTKAAYLSLLSRAMIEIRAAVILHEPQDYPEFCSAIIHVLSPVSSTLLKWSEDQEQQLFNQVTKIASERRIARTVELWFEDSDDESEGLHEQPLEGFQPTDGYSPQLYLQLLERAMEKMKANVEDLNLLYDFSDAFHNVPGSLCYEWTKEREDRVYENLMSRSTDRGIRNEVEEWMYEIVGEPAKVRAANLPF